MTLNRTHTLWGAADLMYGDPRLSLHHDAVYQPYLPHGDWGIYDRFGNIVLDSVDFRGPEKHLRNQTIGSTSVSDINNVIDIPCLYGGYISSHFGHFLVNTLSRLWPLYISHKRPPIVFHGDANAVLSHGFAREIFGALNIDQSNIFCPDKKVRFKELLVPATSFVEQNLIFSIYGDLCRSATRAIGIPDNLDRDLGPIYVSKTRMKEGVGKFNQEKMIEEAVRSAGIDVIYPEKMTWRQQIEIISRCRIITGTVGSFFHNSAFALTAGKSVCLNNIPDINSNYVLIDKISPIDCHYYTPPTLRYEHGCDGFITQTYVEDIDAVAEEFVDLIKSYS